MNDMNFNIFIFTFIESASNSDFFLFFLGSSHFSLLFLKRTQKVPSWSTAGILSGFLITVRRKNSTWYRRLTKMAE